MIYRDFDTLNSLAFASPLFIFYFFTSELSEPD